MSRLKLLTFDVTNTLLKVKVSPAHQYAEAARSFGVECTEAQLLKIYRPTWKKKKQDHPNYGKELGMTTKEWWHDFVNRVFVNAEVQVNAETSRKITDLLWTQFEEGMCWDVLPQSHNVLSQFKNAGVKLGVISNFDERLEKTLVHHDLAQYFDFMVTTAKVCLEKPDPKIFLHALKLGNTNAKNAGHVGDDVYNDYVAARHVGMSAFLFKSGNEPLPDDVLKIVEEKDIIRDLSQLTSLVLEK